MTNLTIPQCLEKLAVLDSEFVKFVDDPEYSYWLFCNGLKIGYGSANTHASLIFYAICDRVDSLDWSLTFTQFSKDRLQPFKYYTGVVTEQEAYQCFSNESLVHALLNGLVQAMEKQANYCIDCNGVGRRNALPSTVTFECNTCSGTGKKLEVKS